MVQLMKVQWWTTKTRMKTTKTKMRAMKMQRMRQTFPSRWQKDQLRWSVGP
jgi:hypothetical protein